MTTAVYIYAVYTVISIAMTVWVAHTLYKNGRVFLLEAFRDKEEAEIAKAIAASLQSVQ